MEQAEGEATMTPPITHASKEDLDRERWEALRHVVEVLEGPMTVLGFVWLGIMVADLVGRSGPLLTRLGDAIWVIFALDFAAEFALAPSKREYLRSQWLVAMSLALPALRVLRFVRLLRVARAVRLAGATGGLTLLRLLTSFNRGMQALRHSMGRRGFGYVAALTVIVVLAGAAGMFAFEGRARTPDSGFTSYAEAVWWTAMIVTTMGSQYWPKTGAGQLLCLLLALYAFAMFGYVTAALATFFVGRDAEDESSDIAGEASLRAITAQLQAIQADLAVLRRRVGR
jgi:voltage-gated potassium channel